MSVSRRTDERGIAMFAAVVIGVLVLGVVAALSSFIFGQIDEKRRTEQGTEATYWVQAVGERLANDLETFQTGRMHYVGMDPSGRYELWRPPGPATGRIQLSSAEAGARQGNFQLRPPVPGAPAGTIAFSVNATDVDGRGTITVVVRGWTDGNATRSTDVRMVLRRGSLSRFSLLSDGVLDLGTLGATTLRGAVHANNADGVTPAVSIAGSAASGVTSITTTRGTISGACPAGRCQAETQQRIPFAAADKSFNLVQELGTDCGAGVLCWHRQPMTWAPPQHVPAWRVDLSGSGCVSIALVSLPLRRDAGTVPSVDDTRPPVSAGGGGSFCPAIGGGAILFDGDVLVQGVRSPGARPITIMARRGGTPPTVSVNGSPAPLSVPASAWIVGSIGSSSPAAPVGIVAEGSAYIPSWAYAAGIENGASLRNVALMTKLGQLSMGPGTMAVVGAVDGIQNGGTNVMAGGGLDPCAAKAAGYGAATSIRIEGSIASRRQPVLQYGTGGCWIGHGSREYTWVDRLGWDPPPAYPSDKPWHVAKWTEGGP